MASMRIRGTTRRKPVAVFPDEERHTLLPWDDEPYEIADCRTAQVKHDHRVQCQEDLYLVPADRCPTRQQVEIRLGSKLVHISEANWSRPTSASPKVAAPLIPTLAPPSYPRTLPERWTISSAARRHWDRRWPNAPTASSTTHYPGPKSGRGIRLSCLWRNATCHSVSTPPARTPWPWTSSMCADWTHPGAGAETRGSTTTTHARVAGSLRPSR